MLLQITLLLIYLQTHLTYASLIQWQTFSDGAGIIDVNVTVWTAADPGLGIACGRIRIQVEQVSNRGGTVRCSLSRVQRAV
jgi:hypothetical protein